MLRNAIARCAAALRCPAQRLPGSLRRASSAACDRAITAAAERLAVLARLPEGAGEGAGAAHPAGARRVVVLLGAGASASAGIPDFRSPGTGLYDNLQEYGLPHPEAIFDLDFFRQSPGAFNRLARELYAVGAARPTPAHCFLGVLEEKGVLLRVYTQNIDSLESQAGVPPGRLVAAHGNFDGAHCIDCSAPADPAEVRRQLLDEGGTPRCGSCGGLVKPAIVFFGEALPARFFELVHEDLPQADVLLVMGTSLKVHPVASIPSLCAAGALRLLINRELVGRAVGLHPGDDHDYAYLGDCDAGVRRLCAELGWEEELEAAVRRTR